MTLSAEAQHLLGETPELVVDLVPGRCVPRAGAEGAEPFILRKTQGAPVRRVLPCERGLTRAGQPTGEQQPRLRHSHPHSHLAPRGPRLASLDSGRGEAAVDLGAHDLAVGRRVVVAAEQRAREVRARTSAAARSPRRARRAGGGDRLPFATSAAWRMPSMSSSARPASCSMPMNTSRRSVSRRDTGVAPTGGRRHEQAAPFVVADRRGGDAGPLGDLADGQQRFGHDTT